MSKSNTGKIVRRTISSGSPTAKQRSQLAKLAAIPDKDIDYSDIPDMSSAVWKRAGELVPVIENKRQITLRIDAEVLEFFKATGARYQTRINAVLRQYVQHAAAGRKRR